MKTINSLRSKLLTLTLALMASVSSFAYDYHGDLLCYNILTDSTVAVIGQSEYKAMPRYEYLPENLIIPAEVTLQGKTYRVVSIDQWAFYACSMLKSVIIPHTVTFIGMSAFQYCENLVDVYIPYSVTTVEGSAFSYTKWYDNLPDGEVYINNTLYRYKGTAPENTQIVVKDGTTRIAGFTFWNQSNIISIELPQTLMVIEHGAFEGCTQLSSILIPKNVTDIGASAFADCTGLTEVICLAPTPPTMRQYANPSANSEIFARIDISNATLYVRSESVEAYKNADQWKEFGQILPIKPITIEDQFPTLWGLQRTVCNEYCGESEEDNSANVTYKHTFDYIRVTSEYKPYILCNGYSLREEDNKVLIYSHILNKDLVLYDFTLEVGDSLPALYIDYYPHSDVDLMAQNVVDYNKDGQNGTIYPADTFVVTDISSVTLLDGNQYKKWTFDNGMEYVEGIGMYGGSRNGNFFGLIQKVVVPCHTGEHLVCASRNGKLLYQMDEAEMERLGVECLCDAENPKELFPTLWGLQRTSCSEYVDCQENETYLMQADEIKEINGKQYLKYGGVFLREEDSKVLIYSFPYEKDFVLYDWTLAIGDTLQILGIDPFSFPELEYTAVVDYVAFEEYDANGNRTIVKKPLGNKRVKDISTMRLLDGNEYKAWLFGYDWERGNYYVEGIGNASKYGGDYVDLVYPFEVPSCYYGERLVCVSRDGVLLYQIDDAEMERLGTECLCEVETSYKSQWCDTWNVMEHNMGGVDDSETTWRHYLANDTIINGQTYTSVNYYWTLEESKVYKIAHVRFSEDKKVYALMDDTEYLVYDFSVQVGDTIETIVGAFYGSMLQQLLVHQIDIDEETNRKTIILFPICKCDEDLYCLSDLPIIWIEGVGTTDGFLMGYPPCDWVGGIGCNLLCAYKDDELKYTGDLYDVYGCEYNATEQKPEDLFPTLWGLQRTSFTEYSECSDSYASLFQSKGETITINYNQYLKFGGHYLREENKQVLLYSRLQDKDLVLYDYSLEVGDTLTTLNIDYRIEGIPFDLCYVDYAYEDVGMSHSIDTLIVTDVSYVTLLDGKEYKKWTFDNGMEYVEGIGNFGQSRWSGNFFGLVKEPAIPTCLMGEHLVCVSKNNKLLYQMDEAEMERLGAECLCDYNRGPRKDNAKNGKIGGRPTPTQWNQLELDLREMENGNTILRAETFSYTLENDSIVANNKTFYQLARQSTKDTAITKSFVGALHFGEDEDNRVYFLRDGVEYVLYDFTAEPGDTIEIFAGINNYPQETTYTHVVVDKDTTEDGACRMFLEVVFPDETTTATNAEKVWLAGLGSIDGIVHNAAQRTSDAHAAPTRSASSETQTSVMLCAWREDSCLYTTNHPEYDTFGCVYNQDPTAIESPTSPSSYQKFLREGQLLIMHNGKTYTVMGIEMK